MGCCAAFHRLRVLQITVPSQRLAFRSTGKLDKRGNKEGSDASEYLVMVSTHVPSRSVVQSEQLSR